jgi:hypothetical protein
MKYEIKCLCGIYVLDTCLEVHTHMHICLTFLTTLCDRYH